MLYLSIKTSSIQEQVYNLQNSSFTASKQLARKTSLARKTYSQPGNKSADGLKKRLLEMQKNKYALILGIHGPFRLKEG